MRRNAQGLFTSRCTEKEKEEETLKAFDAVAFRSCIGARHFFRFVLTYVRCVYYLARCEFYARFVTFRRQGGGLTVLPEKKLGEKKDFYSLTLMASGIIKIINIYHKSGERARERNEGAGE